MICRFTLVIDDRGKMTAHAESLGSLVASEGRGTKRRHVESVSRRRVDLDFSILEIEMMRQIGAARGIPRARDSAGRTDRRMLQAGGKGLYEKATQERRDSNMKNIEADKYNM